MGGMPALSSASASPSRPRNPASTGFGCGPGTAWHRGPWRPRSPPEPQGTLDTLQTSPSRSRWRRRSRSPVRSTRNVGRRPSSPSSTRRPARCVRETDPRRPRPAGEQGGHEPGLHVGAAPAVEAAVADVGTERIGGPGARVALGHDVGVLLEEERRSGLSALHHGVDVGPAGSDGVELRRPTEVAEQGPRRRRPPRCVPSMGRTRSGCAPAPARPRRAPCGPCSRHRRQRQYVRAARLRFRWDQVLEPHQRDIGGLDEPVRRLPVSLRRGARRRRRGRCCRRDAGTR